MYDHLIGTVHSAHGTRVVLRVAGVGYELKVPVRVAAGLRVGQEAELATILHVVDGTPTLLGFATGDERELARQVLAVSGVGPAIALAILSTHSPAEFAGLVLAGDAKSLQKVKGIGGKTAERLCLELRDRVARLGFEAQPGREMVAEPERLPAAAEDATLALQTLGYTEKDARTKVAKAIAEAPDAGTEALIKLVLRRG